MFKPKAAQGLTLTAAGPAHLLVCLFVFLVGLPIRLNVSASLEAQQPGLGRVLGAGVKRHSGVVVLTVTGLGQRRVHRRGGPGVLLLTVAVHARGGSRRAAPHEDNLLVVGRLHGGGTECVTCRDACGTRGGSVLPRCATRATGQRWEGRRPVKGPFTGARVQWRAYDEHTQRVRLAAPLRSCSASGEAPPRRQLHGARCCGSPGVSVVPNRPTRSARAHPATTKLTSSPCLTP